MTRHFNYRSSIFSQILNFVSRILFQYLLLEIYEKICLPENICWCTCSLLTTAAVTGGVQCEHQMLWQALCELRHCRGMHSTEYPSSFIFSILPTHAPTSDHRQAKKPPSTSWPSCYPPLKMSSFQVITTGANHWCWWPFTLIITLAGARALIKLSGHCRWL